MRTDTWATCARARPPARPVTSTIADAARALAHPLVSARALTRASVWSGFDSRSVMVAIKSGSEEALGAQWRRRSVCFDGGEGSACARPCGVAGRRGLFCRKGRRKVAGRGPCARPPEPTAVWVSHAEHTGLVVGIWRGSCRRRSSSPTQIVISLDSDCND